ncbi:glycosyltransferase family 39 protein [Methylocaldum sp.]|uniref:ArnT family glycosyltransferase n=1 Tax=Methylocaldum sp. TaxID=1969727 RepID=UPI002D469B4B|nr:glycosyltransferase family 39 protein [Methylocaldum sp.]HYE35081.1 glycosyltransferase family 39 protein [Methylocaldum sp.]
MPYRPIARDYVLLWCILVFSGLALRPLVPVDETRVVSVAWEMWQRGDFLVPYLNGEPYSHKPPLFQWAIHLGWLIFGVNDWTPRFVGPLFGLANLVLTERLARRLWPELESASRLAPLILLSLAVWSLWTTLTLYDMLVTFFTLLGVLGILRASQESPYLGWLMTAVGIGGGVLSKGPIILLFILPVGLLAPWWVGRVPRSGWPGWYAGILAATVLGATIALVWAIPAGMAGGEEYRRAIFWGQSAGRIANSFAHRRSWLWYAAMLPVLLFPWVLWPGLWRNVKKLKTDLKLRFCIFHVVSVLILLSAISAKQIHYLLPSLPVWALILARLSGDPSIQMGFFGQRVFGAIVFSLGLALALLPTVVSIFGVPNASSTVVEIAEKTPVVAITLIVGLGVCLLLWRFKSSAKMVCGVTGAMIGVVLAAHLIYVETERSHHDMRPIAARIGQLQEQGVSIAHWEKYSGDFQFVGRLKAPLQVLHTRMALSEWLTAHPSDYVVIVYRGNKKALEENAEFAQSYRGNRRVGLWKASSLLAWPDVLDRLPD